MNTFNKKTNLLNKIDVLKSNIINIENSYNSEIKFLKNKITQMEILKNNQIEKENKKLNQLKQVVINNKEFFKNEIKTEKTKISLNIPKLNNQAIKEIFENIENNGFIRKSIEYKINAVQLRKEIETSKLTDDKNTILSKDDINYLESLEITLNESKLIEYIETTDKNKLYL